MRLQEGPGVEASLKWHLTPTPCFPCPPELAGRWQGWWTLTSMSMWRLPVPVAGTGFKDSVVKVPSPSEWTTPHHVSATMHTEGPSLVTLRCCKSCMLSAETVLGTQNGGLPSDPLSACTGQILDPKITTLNNPHSDNHLAPHVVLFLPFSRCSRNPVRLPPFMPNQAWG